MKLRIKNEELRMKRTVTYLIFGWLLCVVVSCGNRKDTEVVVENQKSEKYGGVVRRNIEFGFASLYPPNASDNGSYQILRNVMENLVSFSGSGSMVEPCLAERWEILDSATRFVFHLRKNIYFHDDPCFPGGKGREFKASDVAYCLHQVCEPGPQNDAFWILKDRIKGATEYYESRDRGDGLVDSVAGVHVVDENTIEIILNKPYAGFLNILGAPFLFIYPREAVKKYGVEHLDDHAVGTGPFKVSKVLPGEHVTLIRNGNYWKMDDEGNALPYLDGVVYTFNPSQNELADLQNDKLDIVSSAGRQTAEKFLSGNPKRKFRLMESTVLSTTFIGFQHQMDMFRNRDVRRAFAMAIDIKNLALYMFDGLAAPGEYGVVPPTISGYDATKIRPVSYDPDMAKKLLAKAGYPNGKGFPSIEMMFPEGHEKMGEAVQDMLQKNLNVHVDLVIMPFQELIPRVYGGFVPLFRMGWAADYPDPESFLSLFYGAPVTSDLSVEVDINPCRYKNPEFDALYEKANAEIDNKKRMELYRQADQLLLDDVAAIPLSYRIEFTLIRASLMNCRPNILRTFDFTRTYFRKEAGDLKTK
ncbi:MAG: ABC transporter substrate-binding protein [Flavobacteriales bacterium]|nr:ABC transporter substrate-binding protein [Flavobacteriales bacterium]